MCLAAPRAERACVRACSYYASTVCEFWSENEQILNAGVAVCETEVKYPQNAEHHTSCAVITQNAHGELVRI